MISPWSFVIHDILKATKSSIYKPRNSALRNNEQEWALTSSILIADVRKSPHISQIHCISNDGEEKVNFFTPGLPVLQLHQLLLSFSPTGGGCGGCGGGGGCWGRALSILHLSIAGTWALNPWITIGDLSCLPFIPLAGVDFVAILHQP